MTKPSRPGLRVSIVGMHYAPEPSGNAPYTSALARGLAARGHEVSVITGTPHYPDWKIYPGYGQWRSTRVEDGVTVTRLRHYVTSRPSSARRVVMEASFGVRASLRHLRDADVVVCVSPALFGSAAVTASLQIGRRPPTGLWIQDLYGRGLAETGGSRSGARPLAAFEGRVVRSFDRIVVAHHRFADHLATQYAVDADRIDVIRNWTHQQPSQGDVAHLRRSMGWGEDDVICLHAGNMGVKQGLENVVAAARLAENLDRRLRFVFVGGGNQQALLRNEAAGLPNVEFVASLPEAEFTTALAAADVLIVNERPGVKDMSVPSKLTSYFNSGTPVVAAVDPASVTAEEVRRADAGLCVSSSDPAALVAEIQRLSSDPQLSERLGRNGLAFVESHLSQTSALDSFEAWLGALCAPDRVRT